MLHIVMFILCPRDFRSHVPSSLILLFYKNVYVFTDICMGKIEMTLDDSHSKWCALGLNTDLMKLNSFLIIKNREISYEK